MSDAEIEDVLDRIEAVPVRPSPMVRGDYFRKLAGNLILEARQAIRNNDAERADETLDALNAIFVGKAPGMLENHVEKPSVKRTLGLRHP